MLREGTQWKVADGGTCKYILLRYRNSLICPALQMLIINQKILSIEKLRT
jgi:hypothetical protein